jgi:endonuclease/exonuclease/phosphatase family metal-dependent hydrolase
VDSRAASLLAVGLLTACAATRLNYTDPLGPRYAGGPATAPQHGDTLKVVAFNVENAVHVDRAVRLIQGTDALRDPDVVLLQEMDEPGVRAIAESLGLCYVYYPSTVSPTTHRDFGDAVLSRYPIESDRKIILPHLSFNHHTQREAVAATIAVGGRRVRVYSLHLATFIENAPRSRREQLAAVLADARTYPLVVLGGDFNSASVPEEALAAGFVWPTDHLGRTHMFWDMDHVLVKGLTVAGGRASGIVAHVHGASDHKPVWALVLLPAGTRP